MQFGKGGLSALKDGRESMLSQSSLLSISSRDSFHGGAAAAAAAVDTRGSYNNISTDRRTSRTRSEMIDAIRAHRQGSNTSLNAISIVNTSSFNITPTTSSSNRSGGPEGDRDVITVPRRISKVMGFNKLEFNPMALDQDRSGPLLELGKEELGKEDHNKNNNNNAQQPLSSGEVTTGVQITVTAGGPAAPAQKHGASSHHTVPVIHTVAKIEVRFGVILVHFSSILSHSLSDCLFVCLSFFCLFSVCPSFFCLAAFGLCLYLS